MKSALLLVLSMAIVVTAGCGKEPSANSTLAAPDPKPLVASDGSNVWALGATAMNGTNISATNMAVGIRTREPSK